jgi:subtilisin-like proprotein convertase family protein
MRPASPIRQTLHCCLMCLIFLVSIFSATTPTLPLISSRTAFASAPTPPPGCATTTTTFTQSTPVAIPTGPAAITSTLVISNTGAYLDDLDVQTFLTHTFAADLDITIASPAGTIVTLTTDSGAGNDNTFNGTVWDDDANPAGQVPYVTNNGVVGDHAYVNLTLASPLVPEEALGAFIGEDPNGTWTITISDDAAGEGGSLDSWSLIVTSAAAAPTVVTTTTTQSTPTAIPTGPAVVTSSLVVSGSGTYLSDLNLETFLTHTFGADLDITIASPSGTVVTLTTDNGAGNDNTFNGTIWDDDANPAGQVPYTTNNGLATDHAYVNLTAASPLVPEEAMAAFIGEDPNGTWTITISDDLAGDGGSLDNWSLIISTATACPAMTVLGNGQPIASGSVAASLADGTDYGSVSVGQTITHTFTISNTGATELTLTGSPAVTLSTGADFSVVTQPTSPVGGGGTTSFEIAFSPQATGTISDVVSIASSDTTRSPYTFVIQGAGTSAPPPPPPPSANSVALPLISTPTALPDLVVEQISTAGGSLVVTIKNIGQADSTDPFWVDLYIDPSSAPTGVNQIWPLLGTRGLVWGVVAEIPAGSSLTLTVGDTYYNPQLSAQGGTITAGTPLYAQVDSANANQPEGGVLESHERAGSAYNNISTAQATEDVAELLNVASAGVSAPMPERPR